MTKTDSEASQRISDYITELDDWRGEMIAELRKIVLAANPEMIEEWKWGSPVWSRDGNVCSAGAFKTHVKINFFKGASLDDPKGMFNAGLEAKVSRSIDFNKGDAIDAAGIQALVRAGATLNQAAKKK
jgi:hypothetical protein